MLVSSLSQIVFRVFALHLVISGAISLPITLYYIWIFALEGWLENFIYLAPQLGMVIAGLIVWNISPNLSKSLTKKEETTLPLKTISEQQLCRIALICLGLFLSLSTLAKVLTKLHETLLIRGFDNLLTENSTTILYGVAEPIITFVAGILLVITSRQWSAKLCKKKSAPTRADS